MTGRFAAGTVGDAPMRLVSDATRVVTVPPTIEAALTVAAREIGLAPVSRALGAMEHGKITPDSRVLTNIASEIAGHSPVGVDEVTARYLERLTRTDTHPAGRSPQNK